MNDWKFDMDVLLSRNPTSEHLNNALSPEKCYVMILRYQVYRITLYMSWTTIEPIKTRNQ